MPIFMTVACTPSERAVSTAVAEALSATQNFDNSIQTVIAKTQLAMPTNTLTITPSPTVTHTSTATVSPSATPFTASGNLVDRLPNTTFTTESGWYGWESTSISLGSPFYVKINFEGSGSFPAIALFGRTRTGAEWWDGIHVMYVVAMKNRVALEFRDGRSDTIKYNFTLPSAIKPGSPFTIEFLDVHGNSFYVLDSDDNIVGNYDISKLPGIKMPNGLFPDNQLFVGVLVSPSAEMNIYELSMDITHEQP